MSIAASGELDRRRFLAWFSVAVGASIAQSGEISRDMLEHAEEIAGVRFSDKERELMLRVSTSSFRTTTLCAGSTYRTVFP